MDNTGHVMITVWQNLIVELQEYKWYELTDVSVKSFFGIKLSTTSQTTASIVDDDTVLDWSTVDVSEYISREKDGLKKSSLLSCCPEIVSAHVGFKMPCGLNCTIDFEKDDCTITLTAFKDVLSTFFEEDIVKKYKGDPAALEDTLLELEKIDFSYNTRMVITNMKKHAEEDND
eukprot:gene2577-2976_t